MFETFALKRQKENRLGSSQGIIECVHVSATKKRLFLLCDVVGAATLSIFLGSLVISRHCLPGTSCFVRLFVCFCLQVVFLRH